MVHRRNLEGVKRWKKKCILRGLNHKPFGVSSINLVASFAGLGIFEQGKRQFYGSATEGSAGWNGFRLYRSYGGQNRSSESIRVTAAP